MSHTNSLIDRLSADGAAPETGHSIRFAAPMAGAAVLCLLGTALILDKAFASVEADGIGPIAVKWGFSLALVFMGPIALWTLGKPGRKSFWSLTLLAVPFLIALALLVVDLSIGSTPFPGATWRRCLTAMAIMSPLAFGGAIIAMSALAPTEPRRAGLVAGLFGGAVAMTAYAPFCPENGMLYMAVFYCLPILAMAAIGYLLGPRLLRW